MPEGIPREWLFHSISPAVSSRIFPKVPSIFAPKTSFVNSSREFDLTYFQPWAPRVHSGTPKAIRGSIPEGIPERTPRGVLTRFLEIIPKELLKEIPHKFLEKFS